MFLLFAVWLIVFDFCLFVRYVCFCGCCLICLCVYFVMLCGGYSGWFVLLLSVTILLAICFY